MDISNDDLTNHILYIRPSKKRDIIDSDLSLSDFMFADHFVRADCGDGANALLSFVRKKENRGKWVNGFVPSGENKGLILSGSYTNLYLAEKPLEEVRISETRLNFAEIRRPKISVD